MKTGLPQAGVSQPDDAMLAPIEAILEFMKSLDDATLENIFSEDNVIILDSFSPHLFMGKSAMGDWAAAFKAAAGKRAVADMTYETGMPQLFCADSATAFLSLPVTWTGKSKSRAFVELGALSVVLARNASNWRVQSFSWGSISYDKAPVEQSRG